MTELISVVIPAKDRVEELKATLNSVLQQSYKNIEVLVIENNSNRPEEIDKLAEYFSNGRIFVHHLADCKNANIARNFGARVAKGKYIAFLDSDDEWAADHLEQSLAFLKKRSVDFVYGGAKINTGEKLLLRRGFDLNGIGATDYLLGFNRGYAQTSSFFITKLATSVVSWDESMKRCQDLDYFIRVSERLKIACLPNITTQINWIANQKRDTDLPSMMDFLAKYKRQMKITSYFRYLLICFSNISDFEDLLTFFRRVLK
jgi:glycosyltransferase involved in cell wall biosynthesis